MSYILQFIVFLSFVIYSFSAFAEEEKLDFSLKKVTEEERIFFESFQDLYDAITSTTGSTKLQTATLQPLVILAESEEELGFGMAQSICMSYNVFSAISGKSCYVAKAKGVKRAKAILRYGKNSPSYGNVDINADFIIMKAQDLYNAQRRKGPYADLPYLNAVMFLNSRVDLFFARKEDTRFIYIDDLVAYARDLKRKETTSKKKDSDYGLRVGVFSAQDARNLMKLATDYDTSTAINVQIMTINSNKIEKAFCDAKTAEVDIFYYSSEFHEEQFSALMKACDSKIAVLPMGEYGYNITKRKQFYSPVDLTEALKYRVRRSTMARVENARREKGVKHQENKALEEGAKYQFNPNRIYVVGSPYVLASTRYTHVKDVFYVVMSYSYNFLSSKNHQPVLDTMSLDVVDLFSRPLGIDDLVFHNAVMNYLTYYQVYSLATRRSESEEALVKYMGEIAAEGKTDNVAGPAFPNADEIARITSGNKENIFYEESYLLKNLLERDFDKIREEKIYGNGTSGRFRVDGTLYEVGYLKLLEQMETKEALNKDDINATPTDIETTDLEDSLTESVPEAIVEEVPQLPEDGIVVEEEPKEVVEETPDEIVDPLLGGDSFF